MDNFQILTKFNHIIENQFRSDLQGKLIILEHNTKRKFLSLYDGYNSYRIQEDITFHSSEIYLGKAIILKKYTFKNNISRALGYHSFLPYYVSKNSEKTLSKIVHFITNHKRTFVPILLSKPVKGGFAAISGDVIGFVPAVQFIRIMQRRFFLIINTTFERPTNLFRQEWKRSKYEKNFVGSYLTQMNGFLDAVNLNIDAYLNRDLKTEELRFYDTEPFNFVFTVSPLEEKALEPKILAKLDLQKLQNHLNQINELINEKRSLKTKKDLRANSRALYDLKHHLTFAIFLAETFVIYERILKIAPLKEIQDLVGEKGIFEHKFEKHY